MKKIKSLILFIAVVHGLGCSNSETKSDAILMQSIDHSISSSDMVNVFDIPTIKTVFIIKKDGSSIYIEPNVGFELCG